jgi:hypothetical protein
VSVGGVIVDDHLLLQVLLGNEPASLRSSGAPLSTTGLWYHRLCRALADETITGSMSRSLGDVDARIASATVRAFVELPDTIGLVSLRSLGWPMASLIADGVRLNPLSLEALAAAEMLDAEICLAEADKNPMLLEAAEQRGVSVRLITI